jgi:AcrR family transcriptional regulator
MPSKSSGRKQASSKQSAAVRHRERTEQTRSRLLTAGRTIFARDGFEGAKLEEIASEAGYTRGALYANFESKEDLFIAMLEENIQERISYARKLLAKQHDVKKRIEAFRQLFMEKARERSWALLWLEFKLFALRHPEFKAKLSEMRERVSLSSSEMLEEFFGETSGVKFPVRSCVLGMALGALAHGLQLDHMLDKSIREEEIETVVTLFLDAMLPLPKLR